MTQEQADKYFTGFIYFLVAWKVVDIFIWIFKTVFD